MIAPEPIFAAATGAHSAPRAMIRLSGDGARRLADRLFAVPLKWPGPSAARLKLTDALEVPVLVIAYAGPRSYAGEDSLEILIAGGIELVRRVEARIFELGHDLGIRRAEPGEFSARAYHAGKLTLDQAEGVAAVIAAGSREELESARRVLSGAAGAAYRAWAEELTTLAALVEAGIDFTDQEDVVAISRTDLLERTERVRAALNEAFGARRGTEAADRRPRIVLAGLPNAGKSTLFNALLGRRRAVVSPVAGTTRDALSEQVELSGVGGRRVSATLVDAPGLGDAPANELDALGRDAAKREIEWAAVIVHCDERGNFGSLGLDLPSNRTLRVRTKADRSAQAAPDADLAVCALDGWNLDRLRDLLLRRVWYVGGHASGVDLMPRHHDALSACSDRLTDLREFLGRDHSLLAKRPELVASLLRDSIDALSPLTGRVERDEVIGRVFAAFCVGK